MFSSGSLTSRNGREDVADIYELPSPRPLLGFLSPGQVTQTYILGRSESSGSLSFWGVVDIFIDFYHCTWEWRDIPEILLGSKCVLPAPVLQQQLHSFLVLRSTTH